MFYNLIKTDYRILTRKTMFYYFTAYADDAAEI